VGQSTTSFLDTQSAGSHKILSADIDVKHYFCFSLQKYIFNNINNKATQKLFADIHYLPSDIYCWQYISKTSADVDSAGFIICILQICL
jgi:hypothetical protein